MCLQISNSCHTQVTLSSRPFNIGQKFKSPNFFHPNKSFSGTTQPLNINFCEQISLPKAGWSTSVMNKRLQGKPQTSEVDIIRQRKRIKVLLKCSNRILDWCRVAELGSLSSRAKMAMKILVKRVFTILATNASFLRLTLNLQILLSKICNIYHVIVHFLPKKHSF